MVGSRYFHPELHVAFTEKRIDSNFIGVVASDDVTTTSYWILQIHALEVAYLHFLKETETFLFLG